MGKSLWLTVLAVLVLLAILTLTVDPLGLLKAGDGVADDREADELEVEGTPSLATRGTERGPDEGLYQGDPIGVLDLGLGSASLTGTVQDEGELPIARARIEPLIPEANGRAVRTKQDGTYEIQGLPAGQHELRASREGFRTHTAVGPELVEGGTGLAPTITLRARRGLTDALIVRVTDAFGVPIPAAKVIATTMPWDMHLAAGPELAGVPNVRFKRGRTDDDGKVAMRQMVPDEYNVAVAAPGYVTQARLRVAVSGGGERTLTFRMAPAVAVRGRVVSDAGEPVEGAMVMGMSMGTWSSSIATRSAADGTFVLDDLKPGGYFLIAADEGGGESMLQGKAPSSGVELKLATVGRIKGTISDTEGNPVGEATVRPFRGFWFQYTYSMAHPVAADGTFEIALGKGSYELQVKTADGRVAEQKGVKVEPGETTEVALVVDRNHLVRGVVVDERGDHVEGAEVFIKRGGMPPDKSRENYGVSDADGAFEVQGLAPETVTLHVWHPEYANTTFQALAKSPDEAEEERVVLPAGASIVGTVRDAEGDPVAGEEVTLERGPMEGRTVVTDAGGRYAFHAVAAGDASVKTGNAAEWNSGLREKLSVPASGVVTKDFTMPARGGTVTGLVRVGGKPVAGAEVTVTDTRGPDAARTGTTDEAGRFQIAGVEIGTVRVRARTAGGQEGSKSAQVDKDTLTAEVKITIGNAGVRVRILDSEGQPLQTTWCWLEGAEGDSVGRDLQFDATGQDGIAESTSVRAGTYRLRAMHQQHARYASEPFAVKDGEVTDLGDVRLSRTVTVTGRILNDAGLPVENATVALLTPDGRPVFNWSLATSGSDGRYNLSQIEPGHYMIKFEAKGLAPLEKPIDITAEGATSDATLARGGGLTFRVESDSGEPIAGAKLTLIDDRGLEVTRTLSMFNWTDSGTRNTDSQGRASLDDLAPGSYTVVAAKAGYVAPPQGVPARVASGGTTPVKVVMSPSAGE